MKQSFYLLNYLKTFLKNSICKRQIIGELPQIETTLPKIIIDDLVDCDLICF